MQNWQEKAQIEGAIAATRSARKKMDISLNLISIQQEAAEALPNICNILFYKRHLLLTILPSSAYGSGKTSFLAPIKSTSFTFRFTLFPLNGSSTTESSELEVVEHMPVQELLLLPLLSLKEYLI